MTRQNAIQYATACKNAYARGEQKPNREQWEVLHGVPHQPETIDKYTRSQYAIACRQAYARGQQKPNFEEWKNIYYNYGTINNIEPTRPAQPEKAISKNTTQIIKDNARRQEKALKQINITIKNVCDQMDILDDFFKDLSDKHPEYKTYHKLSDYILGSICDIQEKLQTL